MELLYCDQCGVLRGYEIPSPLGTEKGECSICRRRMGTMNIMFNSDTDRMEDIYEEEIKLCGFSIEQLIGFVPNTPIYNIHPETPATILSKDCTLFIEPDRIILTRSSTGEKIEIRF